jgi:hypothetical protein
VHHHRSSFFITDSGIEIVFHLERITPRAHLSSFF